MRSTLLPCLLAVLVPALAGCNTMTFEITDTTRYGRISSDVKSYFFFGVTPHKKIDMSRHCPSGVAKITEETTFLNGVATVFTFGIWAPRQSTYYCLKGN